MKLVSVVGTAVLLFSTAAFAQPNTSSRGGTMARALEVNARNQAKNPQSQGLPRARQRLLENAEKHALNKADRAERPERPQVALSPGIAERPLPSGLADRPLPRGLVDRPLPPGHARRR